jgi:DNA-binding response OmpR family regulator
MRAGRRPRATILLVEDDAAVAGMLADRLGAAGYCIWRAQTAAEAEAMVAEARPDLIILDLMLPDAHGLVLCARLREQHAVPIIICSGTRRREDPALGFKLGADDFIAKPFSLDELAVRIKAALQRAQKGAAAPSAPAGGLLRIGQLSIDPARRRVTPGGLELRLTPTEYRLLGALARSPDRVLSSEELAARVWGHYDPDIGASLGVHLRRLRAKLKAGPVPPPGLVTVRGFGYRLATEPEDRLLP